VILHTKSQPRRIDHNQRKTTTTIIKKKDNNKNKNKIKNMCAISHILIECYN
jgi:hypothetical protein